MKNILIVVLPSKTDNHPIYKELQTEADKYGKEAKQILYTTFLLTGPKSFEHATSLVDIADRYNSPYALFEIEGALKMSPGADKKRFPVR